MIIYFSGTGNSRWCAELLAQELSDETCDLFSLLQTQTPMSFQSCKPWVFVVPTYAWRMPRLVTDYLSRCTFQGSREAYVVMSCGGDIGNAAQYNARFVASWGLTYRGTLEVVTPENYIAMFDVPDSETIAQQFTAAQYQLTQAAAAIQRGSNFPAKDITVVDRIKSSVVNILFYPCFVHSRKFYATDDCIGCGACQRVCVYQSISLHEGRPQWHDPCTHCMACISCCPVQAIEYGQETQGKIRYQAQSFAPVLRASTHTHDVVSRSACLTPSVTSNHAEN